MTADPKRVIIYLENSEGFNWIYRICFLTVFTLWYINMVSSVKTVTLGSVVMRRHLSQDLAVISLF